MHGGVPERNVSDAIVIARGVDSANRQAYSENMFAYHNFVQSQKKHQNVNFSQLVLSCIRRNLASEGYVYII